MVIMAPESTKKEVSTWCAFFFGESEIGILNGTWRT